MKIERQDMKIPYFNSIYQPKGRKFEKKTLLTSLKKDLDSVIIVLEYYLKEANKNTNITKKASQLSGTKFDFVVNFNYTDTYRVYGIEEKMRFIFTENWVSEIITWF
jgi:hypothetical protein